MFKSFQKKSNKAETTEISPSESFKVLSENLELTEREMIRGILNLSKQNARDIMIPRVDAVTINQETAIKELVNIVSEAGHSRIPVYKDTIDNIIGILYVKDLLKFISEKATKSYLKKILHKPLFIPETMTLDELLIEFQKKRQHLAIVVDEYGGVAGLVTMEDILEEIVGEINDEFDEKELPEIVKVKKGTYDIDSRLSIFDFNNELKVKLPTEEFDTIGGFVFDIFGKIPDKNETIEYDKFIFKIKDIQGTKINRILVTISNTKKK